MVYFLDFRDLQLGNRCSRGIREDTGMAGGIFRRTLKNLLTGLGSGIILK
jgi:hypothetical protein